MILIKAFKNLMKRLQLCGMTGFLAGLIAGFIIMFIFLIVPGMVLSVKKAVFLSLILAAFDIIVLLFTEYIILRYTVKSIFWGVFFNSILTCFFTVFACKLLNLYYLAGIIGMVIGAIIGILLCRLNYLLQMRMFKQLNQN